MKYDRLPPAELAKFRDATHSVYVEDAQAARRQGDGSRRGRRSRTVSNQRRQAQCACRLSRDCSDAATRVFAEPARSPAWLRAYDKFLLGFDTVIGYVVIAAMAVLSAVLILQVFFRYVMNDFAGVGLMTFRGSPSSWSCVLSIPLAFRFNAHVGMDFDLTKLKFISKCRGAPLQRDIPPHPVRHRLLVRGATRREDVGSDDAGPQFDRSACSICLSRIGQAHCCLHVVAVLITGELPEQHRSVRA